MYSNKTTFAKTRYTWLREIVAVQSHDLDTEILQVSGLHDCRQIEVLDLASETLPR